MFDRVKIVQVAGNGIRAIVRETGFNWRTVAKWVPLSRCRLNGSASISVQAGPGLHVMSIGGIKRDENISVLGPRAKSERHRR
jgi:hypothetical protein